MLKDFDKFMSQLKETNATLDFYTDFNKIRRNAQNIETSLNMLNFLLGKDDLYSAVKAPWDRDPKVFNVLDILIATRREGKKKSIDVDGEIKLIKTLFSSVDGIMKFFNERTGEGAGRGRPSYLHRHRFQRQVSGSITFYGG